MGAVGVLSAFMSDNHCLDAVLFLTGSDHHRLFAEHHVADAFSVIANALVTVEPFDFLEVLVFFVEIVAPYAETDSDKHQSYCNGINPFGNCSPDSTVDDAIQ